MNRRDFIFKTGILTAAMASPLRHLQASNPAYTSVIDADSDKILVIVQLFGGNDGLNTVVPTDQYSHLQRVRPEVLLPQRRLLPITPTLAMHPSLTGLRTMFREGSLSILQNVGYPDTNRSHFRSADIWATGTDATTIGTSGWIGRYLEGELPGYPYGYPNPDHPHPSAITIGNLPATSCALGRSSFDLTVDRTVNITPLAGDDGTPLIGDRFGEEMEHLRIIATQTNEYGSAVEAANEAGSNRVAYADDRLSQQLKTVARLIDGGLETKVYTVRLSGFDTHAGQVYGDGSVGLHAELLKNVDDAISAFNKDINRQGNGGRVAGFTYSEFGRRIRSNQSRGTDHGAANLMFLFGPCLHQQVLGNNPRIDPQVDQITSLPIEYDYRDIYGSLLADWFGVSTNRIRDILYPSFNYVPLVGLCGFALPVDLFEFGVVADGKTATLNWKTALEDDLSGFEVERSTDGRSFRYLTSLPARGGAGAQIVTYELPDRALSVGTTYHYRIKSIGHSGQSTYSQVRSVTITGRSRNELTLGDPSPNPARGQVRFDCYAPTDTHLSYSLFNQNGRQVLSDTVYLTGGRENRFQIGLGRLPAGNYTFRFQEANTGFLSRRLVIQ